MSVGQTQWSKDEKNMATHGKPSPIDSCEKHELKRETEPVVLVVDSPTAPAASTKECFESAPDVSGTVAPVNQSLQQQRLPSYPPEPKINRTVREATPAGQPDRTAVGWARMTRKIPCLAVSLSRQIDML